MPHDDYYAAPTLAGDLVRLVPLGQEHASDLFEAADEEVFRHLSKPVPTSLEEMRSFVAWYLDASGIVPWAQVDVARGKAVGMTTYYDIDPSVLTVAIGHTWLGRSHWRQGHNTEAKLLLLRRAFEELGCVRVVWHTDIRNERSQAAISRLGALREGVLRKHKQRPDGTWRDTVVFSMVDDEWPAARSRLEEALTLPR